MAKLVRDEKTPNLGLPLPDVLNDQTVDCQRIAQSFTRLDEAYGEVRLKTTEAVEKAEGAVEAKADAARALEVSESSISAADTALAAAGSAQAGRARGIGRLRGHRRCRQSWRTANSYD